MQIRPPANATAAGAPLSLGDVQLFDAADTLVPITLALASERPGFPAANCADGDPGTRCESSPYFKSRRALTAAFPCGRWPARVAVAAPAAAAAANGTDVADGGRGGGGGGAPAEPGGGGGGGASQVDPEQPPPPPGGRGALAGFEVDLIYKGAVKATFAAPPADEVASVYSYFAREQQGLVGEGGLGSSAAPRASTACLSQNRLSSFLPALLPSCLFLPPRQPACSRCSRGRRPTRSRSAPRPATACRPARTAPPLATSALMARRQSPASTARGRRLGTALARQRNVRGVFFSVGW